MAIDWLRETAEEKAIDPAELLEESGALLRGNFTLASGRQSSYYFDSKKLTLEPKGALFVAERMVAKLDEIGISFVGGMAYGAVPIVSHIALYSALRDGPPIRAFYHRKHGEKRYGTGVDAEGQFPTPRVPVAIIEDVVTTGESLLYSINKAVETDYNVTHAITLVDRDEGGREAVEDRGFKFWALFTVERIGDEVSFVYNGA